MRVLLILLSSAPLVLAACGGASDGRPESAPTLAAPALAEMRMALSKEAVSADAGATAPTGDGIVQHIAYSHALGMRLPVAAIEPTLQSHVSRCQAAGPAVCMVVNSSMTAYSEDQVFAALQIRALPSWIEPFLAGAEDEARAARGEITNRQTTAEDLTVTIIDTDARLKAKIVLQKRIEQLLADRPGKLGELLETERELARINGEIDSLTSTLKALRQRVDMSQLSVDYQTRTNPVSGGALAPLTEALSRFFYNLSSAVAAVITAFAVGLPWLLLTGALLWIWLRLIWPRIRRKKPGQG